MPLISYVLHSTALANSLRLKDAPTFVTARNLHLMFSLLLVELIEKKKNSSTCSFFSDYIERNKVTLPDENNIGIVVV